MTKLLVFSMLLVLGPLRAQESAVSPRPLATAADRLQESWARPITYEDPVWLWSGDLETDKPGVKWSIYPKRRSVEVLAGALKNLNRQQDAEFVSQMVQAANRGADGPRFDVRTSAFGIHIVPAASADASGRMGSVTPLLDQVITVPAAPRMPIEHLRALAEALKGSSGMEIVADTGAIGLGFDRLFAGEERREFVWGAQLQPARDALIDLLGRSATTFSWRFNCQPAASAEDRFCVLGLVPIVVQRTNATGKTVRSAITFDRCKRCPKRLPPPAAGVEPN